MSAWWASCAALALASCAPEERDVGFDHNFTVGGGQGGMGGLAGSGDQMPMTGGMPAEMPDAAVGGMAGRDRQDAGVAGHGGGGGGMAGQAQAGAGGGMVAGGRDDARFNFETSTQQWKDITGSRQTNHVAQPPTLSTERSFAGNASLEFSIVPVEGANAPQERALGVVAGDIGTLPPGATVTYRLWVPADHRINSVQAFMQTFVSGSWTATFKSSSQLQSNAWNTFTVTVPATFAGQGPLEMGFLFNTAATWSGKVWVDSIDVK